MQSRKPNIILITADSLRADRLGCYGHRRPTSPSLDRFAQSSILFSRAIANGPNTPHAFPAIMAARPSLISNRLGLFDAPFALAEVLRAAGYFTVGFNAANPYLSRFFKYDRGFEEYEDYLDFALDFAGQSREHNPSILIPAFDLDRYLVSEQAIQTKMWLEAQINTDCFDAIHKNQGRPLFVWLHYMDTHYPYLPQPAAQENMGIKRIAREENLQLNTMVRENMNLSSGALSRVMQLYEACVRQLDAKIGELFQFLERQDLFESSLIVVAADHGEEFKEHGGLQHQSKLFDELLHVPLLVKPPHWHQARVYQKPVGMLGLAPTILSIVDIASPFRAPSFLEQGVPTDSGRIFASASYYHNHLTPVDRQLLNVNVLPKTHCCVEDHWKLILDSDRKEQKLFNLLADPGETENIVGREKTRASALQKAVSRHICYLEKERFKSQVAAVRRKISSKIQTNHALPASS